MRHRSVVAVVVALLLMSSVGFAQGQGRSEKFTIGPLVTTAFVVGNCGTFDVKVDGVGLITGNLVYNKSGQVVNDVEHYRTIGESLYYNSENTARAVTGAPAELENARYVGGYLYASGPSWKVRVPGYGLIFAETGTLIVDLQAQQIIFNAGHNQFVDKDLAALCDYLK
jgi:hypothetical protein